MTKTKIIIPMLALPLILGSCGEKKDSTETTPHENEKVSSKSNQSEYDDLETKAEVEIRQYIAKFSTSLLMETPPYLEISGPFKTHKYSNESGLIATDLIWQWKSKVDLYVQDSSLRTESGEFTVIRKNKDKGIVAEHLAKAICSVTETGEVKYRRVSSSDYSFRVSKAAFTDLGQPKESFVDAIILGSDEYATKAKAAKVYKDKKSEELRIAHATKTKEDADMKAKKIQSIIKAYKQGDVFKGSVVTKDKKKTYQMTLVIDEVKLNAGDYSYTVSIHDTNESKSKESPNVFKGTIDSNQTLILRSGVTNRRSHNALLFSYANVKITIEDIDNEDKLKFKANLNYSNYEGTLYRVK